MAILIRAIMKLIIGLVIFIGLPILGWGITDISGFFSNPARLGYAILIVLLQIIIVIKLPEAGRNRGRGKQTVARQRIALLLLQLIPLAIVVIAPYCDHRAIFTINASEFIRYLGLGLFVLGMIGMHWAEARLDKQFSVQVTIQENHQLITDGPYRYIRHPRYMGIIIFISGIALIFRSWLALILVAALTIVLFWRIYDEEMLMRNQFGAAWDTYCRKSWRLIPFVY
jgi:protein-S-isoprenylcysteine O-methyltransferase Ste14